MFYCEPCRIKNKWPDSFSQSRGPCEVCNVTRICYDLPSSSLPQRAPPPQPADDAQGAEGPLSVENKPIDDSAVKDDVLYKLLCSGNAGREGQRYAAGWIAQLTREKAEHEGMRKCNGIIADLAQDQRDDYVRKLSTAESEHTQALARLAKAQEALQPFADAEECTDECSKDSEPLWESASAMQLTVGDLRAARAALTDAPEPIRKFARGQRVTKIRGSKWTGHVRGFYDTELNPIGYVVESETEKGSVQLYPEAALADATEKKDDPA